METPLAVYSSPWEYAVAEGKRIETTRSKIARMAKQGRNQKYLIFRGHRANLALADYFYELEEEKMTLKRFKEVYPEFLNEPCECKYGLTTCGRAVSRKGNVKRWALKDPLFDKYNNLIVRKALWTTRLLLTLESPK